MWWFFKTTGRIDKMKVILGCRHRVFTLLAYAAYAEILDLLAKPESTLFVCVQQSGLDRAESTGAEEMGRNWRCS